MVAYSKGPLIAEGKTKKIFRVKDHPELVWLEAKDDITAGDGAKHDVLQGKAALATETTCNVFVMLNAHSIPLAYHHRVGTNAFLAYRCDMLPYEVVARREAHGSYLKRHPNVEKGYQFDELAVEFFLKTTGRQWRGRSIPADDPLIVFKDGESLLYLPDQPVEDQTSFWAINGYPIRYQAMEQITAQTFTLLEQAWQQQGRRLVDFKVEFGIDDNNRLLLADVIDNDSWRVVEDDHYIDKQVYRDGGKLDDVLAKYQQVAELTKRFVYIA